MSGNDEDRVESPERAFRQGLSDAREVLGEQAGLVGERLEAPEVVGEYELLARLGQGAIGVTYLGRHVGSGQPVAVKAIQLVKATNRRQIELFEREAEALKALAHPQIPHFIETMVREGRETFTLYLAQEFVRGRSLYRRLMDGHRFTPAETVDIMLSCLYPLVYLHGLTPPLFHRDIKPSNIIQRPDGSCVLIDFGAVREALSDPKLGGSSVVGTFGYMAPEQFQARVCAATDLYSLGATAVHLLTGRSPAELQVSRLKPDIHTELRVDPLLAVILDLLLEPAAEDRYQTAESLRAALLRWKKRRADDAHRTEGPPSDDSVGAEGPLPGIGPTPGARQPTAAPTSWREEPVPPRASTLAGLRSQLRTEDWAGRPPETGEWPPLETRRPVHQVEVPTAPAEPAVPERSGAPPAGALRPPDVGEHARSSAPSGDPAARAERGRLPPARPLAPAPAEGPGAPGRSFDRPSAPTASGDSGGSASRPAPGTAPSPRPQPGPRRRRRASPERRGGGVTIERHVDSVAAPLNPLDPVYSPVGLFTGFTALLFSVLGLLRPRLATVAFVISGVLLAYTVLYLVGYWRQRRAQDARYLLDTADGQLVEVELNTPVFGPCYVVAHYRFEHGGKSYVGRRFFAHRRQAAPFLRGERLERMVHFDDQNPSRNTLALP